jgi:Rrf2 family transcriptional regulator, cysteine metabolism repressor
MKISRRAEYALRALIELALHQDQQPFQAQELSRRERISIKFLEQILLDLKKAGLLQSRRGAGGGYTLNRHPDRVSLGEVIRLIDGPLDLLDCISGKDERNCVRAREGICGLRSVMLDVRETLAGSLDRISLSDICARTRALRQPSAPLYYI